MVMGAREIRGPWFRVHRPGICRAVELEVGAFRFPDLGLHGMSGDWPHNSRVCALSSNNVSSARSARRRVRALRPQPVGCQLIRPCAVPSCLKAVIA
jgi:hypothetical protein